MPYIDPSEVTSPHARLKQITPIKDTGEGEGGWSAALLEWDSRPRVGLRWNGGGDDKPHPGNPQSRGLPTWFVVPEVIAFETLKSVIAAGLGGGRIDEEEAKTASDEYAKKLEAAGIAVEGQDFRERVEAIVLDMKERGEI